MIIIQTLTKMISYSSSAGSTIHGAPSPTTTAAAAAAAAAAATAAPSSSATAAPTESTGTISIHLL